MVGVDRGSQRSVQVIHLAEGQSSVGLHMGICGAPGADRGALWDPAMPLLLLPTGYRVVDPSVAAELMSELLLVSLCSSN